MDGDFRGQQNIPTFGLYGEGRGFPDVLHCERIADRAARHGWKIAPHRHPEIHQFLLLETGRAGITVEGREMMMEAPALLNIPCRTVHGFTFEAGAEGAVLSLPLAELPEAFSTDTALAARLAQWGITAATPELFALMAAIGDQHREDGITRAPMLRALAMQLVCWFVEAHTPLTDPPAIDRLFHEFEELASRHFRDRLSIRDYAARLRVSATHLNRITNAATGLSALKLIETMIFREARRELAYTRLTIGQIAHGLGYEDPSYFTRAFRAHTGMTPRAYRNSFG